MIPESSASMRQTMMGIAQTLRAGSGELVDAGPPSRTLTRETVMPRPARIGIIVDGSCASSTEQFLLAAEQSDKVTVFGARTAGAVDFLTAVVVDAVRHMQQVDHIVCEKLTRS